MRKSYEYFSLKPKKEANRQFGRLILARAALQVILENRNQLDESEIVR